MDKLAMVQYIASTLSNGDLEERARLVKYHMEQRTLKQVKESFQRWRSIGSTTQREINRNCQMSGLFR